MLIVACVIRELRGIDASQPTHVKFHDYNLWTSDDPILIPTQPGTGMINLRKFRYMDALLLDAAETMTSPYSVWYRLFPEDAQFPAAPVVDVTMLRGLEGTRRVVERGIRECWMGSSVDGNWERSLHTKKILASAGF